MRQDLAWWQAFLSFYNGVSVIKPADWCFADFRFTTDACLTRGGVTCLDFVLHAVSHISALKLHCYCRGKVLRHSIATSAISRLLRQ